MEGIKNRIDAGLAAALLLGMRVVLVWSPLAFGAATMLYLGYLGLKNFGPDSIKYHLQYGVDSDHVYIGKVPHDCDWDTAPLGKKNCHYEKRVLLDRSDTQVGTIRNGYVFIGSSWTPVTTLTHSKSGALQPPQVGAVENGYVYTGGNPADKTSWTPVTAEDTGRVVSVSVKWQRVLD